MVGCLFIKQILFFLRRNTTIVVIDRLFLVWANWKIQEVMITIRPWTGMQECCVINGSLKSRQHAKMDIFRSFR